MLRIFTASTALALLALPAAAQGARAGNVTVTGQTRPPSRDASPTSKGILNRRSVNAQNQDRISRGICIGCNAK